jgi:hypothetical protein
VTFPNLIALVMLSGVVVTADEELLRAAPVGFSNVEARRRYLERKREER